MHASVPKIKNGAPYQSETITSSIWGGRE